MKKQEVYSLILSLMKRIESARDSQFNKLNKILFLTIYYNIFESKYDEAIKDDGKDEEQLKAFIESFNIGEEGQEENMEYVELNNEEQFKRVEEKSVLKYKEAKESIDKIKEEKIQIEKGNVNQEEVKIIEENSFKKIEENNILEYKNAKAEIESVKENTNILENKEDKKETHDDSRKEDNFKKVDENNILKYKEAKVEVDSIKENINILDKQEGKIENYDSKKEEEFKKIDEKNIITYGEVKGEIKKIKDTKLQLENNDETQQIHEMERVIDDERLKKESFKKIDEKNIVNYKEVKESINNIKQDRDEIEKKYEKIYEVENKKEDEFKKIEEKNILNYKDVKESIDEINKNSNLEVKKEEDKNKFHKIEERNINNNIEVKQEIEKIIENNEGLKKNNEMKNNICQYVTNDVRAIVETKATIKTIDNKENKNVDIKNINNELPISKVKVSVKVTDVVINEILYGRIKFSKPILKIIDVENYVIFKSIDLVKSPHKPNCKDATLIYDGVVRVDIEYLEDTKMHCKSVDAVPKYYLMYIPFSGNKSVNISDEDFVKERFISDKMSFDMRSSEFANDTVLKEKRCIGPFVTVYEECEAFIILECVIDILMKKIVETI